jgi:hypothetical protein
MKAVKIRIKLRSERRTQQRREDPGVSFKVMPKAQGIASATVWTLSKDGQTAEARVHIVPHENGLGELRFYQTGKRGTIDLVASQTLAPGDAPARVAAERRRELESLGWTESEGAAAARVREWIRLLNYAEHLRSLIDDQLLKDAIAVRTRTARWQQEATLWTLAKGDGRAEARVRTLPIGPGRAELRYYVGPVGQLTLTASYVLDAGEEPAAMAAKKRREFEEVGWAALPGEPPAAATMANV